MVIISYITPRFDIAFTNISPKKYLHPAIPFICELYEFWLWTSTDFFWGNSCFASWILLNLRCLETCTNKIPQNVDFDGILTQMEFKLLVESHLYTLVKLNIAG